MPENNTSKKRLHYAWVIAFTGTLVIFACLGFGRFALGMLLPSMASSLGLTYSQIGFISGANFLGYLISVLVIGHYAVRLGPRRTIVIALFTIAASMAAISRAKTYTEILLLYSITGMGSGAANVPMMGLITSWFGRTLRGRAAGFVVIGSGFAIIISGKLIPFVNRTMGAEGWRTSWLILSGLVACIGIISAMLVRNTPREKGLGPLGEERAATDITRAEIEDRPSVYRNRSVYLLGAIYFLFGYTYVIYATFIVTSLVKERGFSEAIAGNFWAWVGFLSIFSGPVFGTLSDRLGRKAGLAAVFSIQTVAYILAALNLPKEFLYLSIFFFGICAWSIPSIMIAAVSEYVGAGQAYAAFGFVTFILGIGQIIGPSVAGIIAQRTGGFASSFMMAAVLSASAIAITGSLKKPGR